MFVAASLCIAGCAVEAGSSDADEALHDDVDAAGAAVLNGWIFNEDDFNGIVRLWAWNARFDEWRQFCTGVLLTNDVVITARHCVDTTQASIDYGWPDLTHDVSAIIVSTGALGLQGDGVGAPVFVPDGRDLAVFKISRKLTVKSNGQYLQSGFFRSIADTPAPGAYLASFGYGSTIGDAATSTICEYVSLQTGNKIPGCVDDPLHLSGGGGTYVSNENRVIVAGLTGTHGDSGGATVINTNGPDLADYPLLGINASAEACNEGGCGLDAARVDDLRTWLHALVNP